MPSTGECGQCSCQHKAGAQAAQGVCSGSGHRLFPAADRQQTDAALKTLETAISRALSLDEPSSQDQPIEQLDRRDYQGRLWATRKRPWVDRLASAWLIRRCIDPTARILWLDTPSDCPAEALGFDFDGATFSHVGSRVTFEVLATSFSLDSPAISKLGLLVHYLDVGGVQPPKRRVSNLCWLGYAKRSPMMMNC